MYTMIIENKEDVKSYGAESRGSRVEGKGHIGVSSTGVPVFRRLLRDLILPSRGGQT